MCLKRKNALPLTILLFLSLFLLYGCATNPVSGKKEFMIISEAEEIELGRRWYPSILWGAEGGGGEYKDEVLKSYLKSLVLEIHRVSHRPNLPIEFVIQNSSVPNAWAIPGYVAITRGLLCALRSEAEFVYVMGHEIGHVSARHSASQISRSFLADLFLRAASYAIAGRPYSDFALFAGSLGTNLLLLKYSREDELEADRLGVEYMAKLGYDPKAAIDAHRNLIAASNDYLRRYGKEIEESLLSDLFSTHPRSSVRVEELRSFGETITLPYLRGDGINREVFESKLARIRWVHSLYTEYYDKAVLAFRKERLDEAERLITKALSEKQDEAPFITLYGFINLKRGKISEAEKAFLEALKIDPDYQVAKRGLGMVNYEKGEYSKASQILEQALKDFPQDATSHYFLGMTFYKSSQYLRAINHLEIARRAFIQHPTINGVLGICYERVGNLVYAREAYLRQLKIAPNNEMGRYASSRLRALGR